MMKALVNLLCCFIPKKERRHKVRCKLIDTPRRRKELLDYGFIINDSILTTLEGVKFDIFERFNEKYIFRMIDLVMIEYHFENPARIVDILAENGFAIQVKKLTVRN